MFRNKSPIKKEIIEEVASTSWELGVCTQQYSFYKHDKSPCKELQIKMDLFLKKAEKTYPSQSGALKNLSLFAIQGGRTAALDKELREHGFDHNDICPTLNAQQMFNELQRQKNEIINSCS